MISLDPSPWKLPVAAGVAGALSGMLVLYGSIGAGEAMCLVLGSLWLGYREKSCGRITQVDAILAGLGSGTLAALFAGGVYLVYRHFTANERPDRYEIPFLTIKGQLFMAFVMAVPYGIAIHWGYYQRRRSQHPLSHAILWSIGACFIAKELVFCSAYLGTQIISGEVSNIAMAFMGATMTVLISSVATFIPFSILWIWVHKTFDPAWAVVRAESRDNEIVQ